MLSTQHLYEEIENLEKVCAGEKDGYKQAVLKAQILNLKMLHSLRTNSVQIMKHFKIQTVKPKEKTADASTEQ